MNLGLLISLLHYRWNLSIVAELHRHNGAKFITLHKRLGASRSGIYRCLDALAAQGLVRKNPGHGHPMRPEYLLTPAGRTIAEPCTELLLALKTHRDEQVGLKKWSLPLVAVIGVQETRFGELRAALMNITPRALTLSLKTLEKQRWVKRHLINAYPPAVTYELGQPGLIYWDILQAFDSIPPHATAAG